jgi:hypothetical protein
MLVAEGVESSSALSEVRWDFADTNDAHDDDLLDLVLPASIVTVVAFPVNCVEWLCTNLCGSLEAREQSSVEGMG